MARIVPRNWRDFQHYKDRNPPWIRLHKTLLDNYEYQCLPVASKALAPMLWLLASDSVDGSIDADPRKLAFRLRMTDADVVAALKPLIDNGFFSVVGADSNVLAECLQPAVPEAEALQRHHRDIPEEKPQRASRSASLPCPSDVDSQIWADWLQLRKAKRAPVTATVIDGARTEADKAGMSINAFLRVWCARGSQGLEASWLKPGEGGRAPQAPAETFRERDARLAAERVAAATGGILSARRIQPIQPFEVIDAAPARLA